MLVAGARSIPKTVPEVGRRRAALEWRHSLGRSFSERLKAFSEWLKAFSERLHAHIEHLHTYLYPSEYSLDQSTWAPSPTRCVPARRFRA